MFLPQKPLALNLVAYFNQIHLLVTKIPFCYFRHLEVVKVGLLRLSKLEVLEKHNFQEIKYVRR